MILCKQKFKPSKNTWKHAEFVNKFLKIKGKKKTNSYGNNFLAIQENFNIATYLVAYLL